MLPIQFPRMQWISTEVHMDPVGTCNITDGPHIKYKELRAHSDILVVHDAIPLQNGFIAQHEISIVIYTILK